MFVLAVFFGSVFKLGNVLDFSDLMVLGMAFPNILGILFLVGKVRNKLDDYWNRYQAGEVKNVLLKTKYIKIGPVRTPFLI